MASNTWGGARPRAGRKLAVEKTNESVEALIKRCRKHWDKDENVGIDPLVWWFAVLNDPEQPVQRRDRAAEMLATYTIARPKPIDEEGSSDNKVQIVIKDFSAITPPPMISHVITNEPGTEDESTDD